MIRREKTNQDKMNTLIVFYPGHETSELVIKVNGDNYRINLFTETTSWICHELTGRYWDRTEFTEGKFLSDLVEYADGSRKPSPRSEPFEPALA